MTARPTGLREAHAHIYQLGRSMNMLDLSGCGSGEEMLELVAGRVEAQVRERRLDALVLAHSARPESWNPPRWPSLTDLDRVTGSIPCCCWCFDYHALMANSPMMALAGQIGTAPDPPGGRIERGADGRATGVMYERAALDVWGSVPEPSGPERFRLVESALQSVGGGLGREYAEVHDLKSQPWLGPVIASLQASGFTQVWRIALYPLLQDLEGVLATRREWEHRCVRLAGAKIFTDGTLNSRTAWMLEPFIDAQGEHPTGMAMMSVAEIESAIRRCAAHGLQLAAHAIGDGAVRAVLDAAERARPPRGTVRIEHAEFIHPGDVPRFADLGVIASVQPCHLLYDIEALRRGAPDRLDRVLPLRSLIDSGLTPGVDLIFGSDTPIVGHDPEDSILAATVRGRAGSSGSPRIAPEQAISEAEAWACFSADHP